MASSLDIVHCFRAPVGGLFRHVRDLTRATADRGHRVGIICADGLGGAEAEAMLSELESRCALGVHRVRMRREVGPWDIATIVRVLRTLPSTDILHGHGAKGGAYARLARFVDLRSRARGRVVYTPHGGTLHEDPKSVRGRAFNAAERILAYGTDGMLFTSAYSAEAFRATIGALRCPSRVVHNGVDESDFETIASEATAEVDFVFVGELRRLKGLDLMLRALVDLDATAIVVGSGPDEDELRALSQRLGLDARVQFVGWCRAKLAFPRARCFVMPSRGEDLPYIVLEAAAAGIPLIASRVGGIPEIVGAAATSLVTPDSVESLRAAMRAFLARPEAFRGEATRLRERVARDFRVEAMADSILDFYRIVATESRRNDARARVGRASEPR